MNTTRRPAKKAKRRRRPDLINQLARKHGHATYALYLKSEHWIRFRAKYAQSGLPTACIACGHPSYQLHHTNYQRFGHERLTDVIPLCAPHHRALHKISRKHKIPLSQPELALHILQHSPTKARPTKARPIKKSGPTRR